MDNFDLSIFTESRAKEGASFYPSGYIRGKTRYIFITGGVMSGIGKGVFSGSLCSLLVSYGLSVSSMKCEGYLNVDSGTINPERHGEVFVLDDGTECDLDLGSYERFLDSNLSKNNFCTTGKIFYSLLQRERRGDFLGRDLQIIPHLTGEIQKTIRNVTLGQNLDIIVVEVGGTVGDLENANYLEALREIALEEGRDNVMFCHVTPLLYDQKGEPKTKPTQHSVSRLQASGIQPDLIVLRSSIEATDAAKNKISLFCNVPANQVISCVDSPSIYTIPYALLRQGILGIISNVLGVTMDPSLDNIPYKEYIDMVECPPKEEIKIGVCGKYDYGPDSYLSIVKALEHCEPSLKCKVSIKWINAEDFERNPGNVNQIMSDIDALIVPGGFGKRGIEGMIKAIQEAREKRIPFLGICLGFQLAIIEFARQVCGMSNANSTEFEAQCELPLISLLEEQKGISAVGATMRLGGAEVILSPNSNCSMIYGTTNIHERFRHRYEFDRNYESILEKNGLHVVGTNEDGQIAHVIEVVGHPYFICTQYHPEFTSRPLQPHPLFLNLCKASLMHKRAQL
ncbi:glutamine hydrolyzing CTP synthase [Chloroflexota bacterium]